MLASFRDISLPSSFARAWAMPAFCASLVTSAWAWAVAAMNGMRELRTACCIGSLVVPSKTIRLITVSIADSATNELPHSVRHVLVISPQPVHPTHHERIALPQDIEKSPPFRAFAKASRDTRYAVVRQHQIRFKSKLVSVGSLVLEGLVNGAYAAIQNSFHRLALMTAGASSI